MEVDKPNCKLEFLTTSIGGLINDNLFTDVGAVTKRTIFLPNKASVLVGANLNALSVTLWTKYPVLFLSPTGVLPLIVSYQILSPVTNLWSVYVKVSVVLIAENVISIGLINIFSPSSS